MNYYQILEVETTASNEEIRNSYKRLIKKYHPDVYKYNKEYAENITKKLNDAYDTLSNPEKRAEYDLSLFPSFNSDTNSTINNNTYENYDFSKKTYNTVYTVSKEKKETWIEKLKKKLYNFVDQRTKNLNHKKKILLVLAVIFLALFITLISIYDYLNFIAMSTK